MKDSLFIRACKRQETERTPVWIMRQAGRYLPEYRAIREKYDFLTSCKTPEIASEITIQPIDIIKTDAAILFSDILVIPEAMGMHLELIESVGPVFDDPVRKVSDLDKLRDRRRRRAARLCDAGRKDDEGKAQRARSADRFFRFSVDLGVLYGRGQRLEEFRRYQEFYLQRTRSRRPAFADSGGFDRRISERKDRGGLRRGADIRYVGEHFDAARF